MQKNKVDIITLGCSKNLVDSEQLMAQFKANGYKVAHDPHKVNGEIVVVNTCGFIGDAQEESINMILELAEAKKRGKIRKLFVMGCLSERFLKDLEHEIPEVDKFYGKFNWTELLADLGKQYHEELRIERTLTTPSHYAYLKISEGCNWKCGYCAIPLIRGPHVSVPMEELEAEARKLAAEGVRELIVIAQDTTYYGLDLYGRRMLGELLRRLCRIEGIAWIRLHYAYPAAFPDDVIEVMASEPKICKYLDIPFQAACAGRFPTLRYARLCSWVIRERRRPTLRNCSTLSARCVSTVSGSSPTPRRRGPIRPASCTTTYPRTSSRSASSGS